MTALKHGISPEDYHALSLAYEALEHPSFAARMSSLIGFPLGQALRLLPRQWHRSMQKTAEASIARAAEVATNSLGERTIRPAQRRLHRALAMGTGAFGGVLGVPGLAIELPLTTVLMLRSIADIARSHGEDLARPEARFACMAVFAFGGRTHDDDYAQIGYYEVRSGLALHFSTAMGRMMSVGGNAPVLPASVEVIRVIAARFGVVISDKVAAQLVPVVGASTGALINAIFMQHFQSVADGHFTIRALERKYDRQTIEAAYDAMFQDEGVVEYSVKPGRRKKRA